MSLTHLGKRQGVCSQSGEDPIVVYLISVWHSLFSFIRAPMFANKFALLYVITALFTEHCGQVNINGHKQLMILLTSTRLS